MIARGRKWIGHAFEQVLFVVFDERRFAVHHPVVDDDLGAKGMTDALMAEANTQQGNLWTKGPDDVVG